MTFLPYEVKNIIITLNGACDVASIHVVWDWKNIEMNMGGGGLEFGARWWPRGQSRGQTGSWGGFGQMGAGVRWGVGWADGSRARWGQRLDRQDMHQMGARCRLEQGQDGGGGCGSGARWRWGSQMGAGLDGEGCGHIWYPISYLVPMPDSGYPWGRTEWY